MDLSRCGIQPAAQPQDIMDYITIDLVGMYEQCSMGRAQVDAKNSVVITVPFPCGGRSGMLKDGTQFWTNSCKDNVVPWQVYAEEYVQKQNIDPLSFHHRVLVLPQNHTETIGSDCQFTALASLGRWDMATSPGNDWGSGIVWICGDCWRMAPTYLHELGHNYGLQHARSEVYPNVGNTNDITDAMGGWGGNDTRCYNAPHMWAMGWSSPETVLTTLPVSVKQIDIQVQASTGMTGMTGMTGISITVTPNTTIALSYRIQRGTYDRPFPQYMHMDAALAVHRTPSGVATTDTVLLGLLSSVGESWVDSVTLLQVTMHELRADTVTVVICKRLHINTSCYK